MGIPFISGREDHKTRPGSPEAVDDDTIKPFIDAQNTSDQSGMGIASEVGNFEESFAEENDIDIACKENEDKMQELSPAQSSDPFDVIEYHATESDAIEVIPILSGKEDNIARPGSPEAVDDDTIKPFIDAKNTSDQSGLSIASEVGNFEESFAEENDIDIASSDSDLVTKKDPSSHSESLQENSFLSLSSHDALVEDSKEDLVSNSFPDQENPVSSSLIISRSKRR